MSDLRTAALQALEFLDEEFGWSPGEAPRVDAFRAALAQEQAEQAWVCPEAPEERTYSKPGYCENCGKPLVLAQEQAEPFTPDAIHATQAAWKMGYEARRAEEAEPEQKPVAWRYQDARGNYRYRGYAQGFDKEYSRLKPVPLYTAPQKLVPLTEEELINGFCKTPNIHQFVSAFFAGARYAERAHGIGGQE